MREVFIRSVLSVLGIMVFVFCTVCIGYVMAWGVSFITGESFISGCIGLLTACICAAFTALVLSES